MSRPPLWVVGAGGLLGGAVVRAARARGVDVLTSVVPWDDPVASGQALRQGLHALLDRAAGGDWQIAWCAGAGVVATPQVVLDAELAVLGGFGADLVDALGAVGRRRGGGPSGDGVARGAFFLASSAGGVYAGSPGGVYDESSPTAPLAPYGRAKLAGEQVLADVAARTGMPLLVGRIANLYGPGQRLGKAQGVISQICAAHLSGQPSNIYVSLDTVRDYLYVDDAAGIVLDGLDGLPARAADGPVVKVLASQRAVTLAAVLAECRRVFKRAPRVVLSASPKAANQVLSLRFASHVWPELDDRELTPLPVGIWRTLAGLQAIARAPRLVR